VIGTVVGEAKLTDGAEAGGAGAAAGGAGADGVEETLNEFITYITDDTKSSILRWRSPMDDSV
jgi:hypothetical protein